jgi:fermentation-respiration switch protein FrsA (DUF1100 family)
MAAPPGMIARIGYFLLILAAIWCFLRWFEWSNVYHPTRRFLATPAEFGARFEEVHFVAEDGVRLHGWWIPGPAGAGTLLYCHGNAGNIGDRSGIVADLSRLGVNVFIFDYRGYGKSRGWPNEIGTYRDARAAYEVARARHDDTEQPPIIAYGRSLGAAVAVQLAVDKPLRGLVLEGAFTSTRDMARELFPGLPVHLICRYRYDSGVKVPALRIPKLMAHGRRDEVVPIHLGRRLYDRAAEPKQFYELPGFHNDVAWAQDPHYWDQLGQFVRACLPGGKNGNPAQ